MENSKLPAFPDNDNQIGLTKLEFFAGQAMQGILASMSTGDAINVFNQTCKDYKITSLEATSKMAIENAKELLKQLDEEK